MEFEKEKVYLWGNIKDEDTFNCPIETSIVLFVLNYCEIKNIQCCVVSTRSDSIKCTQQLPIGCLPNVELLPAAPEEVTRCTLPAIQRTCLVRTGLCAVLRHIVKTSDQEAPERGLLKLLGYKGICLKSCAEVSVWTKFCEIEIPQCIEHLYRENGSDEGNSEFPKELLKLENHFGQPPIIPNISKRKRQAVKRFKQQNAGQEGEVHEKQSDLEHIYAEGTDMTLTDLILYPCVTCYLNQTEGSIRGLEKTFPRVLGWYGRLQQSPLVTKAANICRLPRVDLPVNMSSQGLTSNLPDAQQSALDVRRDQLRGEYEVGYQQEGRPDPSADPEGVHEGLDDPSVDTERVGSPRDPNKKKFKAHSAKISQVMEKLERCGIEPREELHPCGLDVKLSWDQMPPAINPAEGDLPGSRVARKCEQLENLAQAVVHVARPGQVIVDFCSGGGHLGIVLAHLLPSCKVILVENKEESILRAEKRIKTLRLSNIMLYQCNMDYFVGAFDVGVCLHACGVATDLVLQRCLDHRAAFVICPCCYGGVQNTHTVQYPRSQQFKEKEIAYEDYLVLGHTADQTEFGIKQAAAGKKCMLLIDTDRAALAREQGYQVTLCSLQPASCSPKNDLLIGVLGA